MEQSSSNFMHGGDIYSFRQSVLDFSANLNPLGLPPGVKEAIEAELERGCRYPDPYCRELRMAIAKAERVEDFQILCGNGAADLIFRLVLAVKPKKALLVSPCFSEYEHALSLVGCDINFFPLQAENGFTVPQEFLEQLTPDVDVCFLCNPNNPTGIPIEPLQMEDILIRAAQSRITLVVDECFLDLMDRPERYTIKPHLKRFPNVLLLKAFTKTHAMAGIRLGYGICANFPFLEKIRQAGPPWSVSSLAQAAGIQAAQDPVYLAEGRRYVQQEREFLKEELQRLGVRVFDSQANFLFFQTHPGLAERLEESRILIRECKNFRGLDETYYRMAVRTRGENRTLMQTMRRMAGSFFHAAE